MILRSNSTANTIEDGAGDIYLDIPDEIDGWNLIDIEQAVGTSGTTGTQDVQVHNLTQTSDMLSTKSTIDS